MVEMKKTTASRRRFRRRYIGFTVESKKFISRMDMNRTIKSYCHKILAMDSKRSGITLVRFNGKVGIIGCGHLYKEKTINLLNSINRVGENDVKIKTISTSGTIKALLRKNKILKDLIKRNSNRKF